VRNEPKEGREMTLADLGSGPLTNQRWAEYHTACIIAHAEALVKIDRAAIHRVRAILKRVKDDHNKEKSA